MLAHLERKRKEQTVTDCTMNDNACQLDKNYISKDTERIQRMDLEDREVYQLELRKKSNENFLFEPEICILCGELTLSASRYCIHCKAAVTRKFRKLMHDNFTAVERDMLDDQIEGYGIDIEEE